jgi:hypothetical protein
LSEQLNDRAAMLAVLDARNALGLLDKEGQAALNAIAAEYERMIAEHDQAEHTWMALR